MRLARIAVVALSGALLLPSGAALGQDASPAASEAPSAAPVSSALAAAFPDEIGGISLTENIQVVSGAEAFADDPVASEPVLALTDSLGLGIEEVTLASAYTFDELDDERGVLIIAVHVPGMDAAVGRQLMLDLFTDDADEHTVGEAVIAEKALTSLTPSDDSESVAYVYASDDKAWLIAAPLAEELEEAISKLP